VEVSALAAAPDAFVAQRTLTLTPAHAEQLTAILRDLASQPGGEDGQPYRLLLHVYQPR